MAQDFYITPENVVSPKSCVSDITILRPGTAGDWSLAKLKWCGRERYAMRWNGDSTNNGIGNPQSRGVPTWFVLPDQVGSLIESSLNMLN